MERENQHWNPKSEYTSGGGGTNEGTDEQRTLFRSSRCLSELVSIASSCSARLCTQSTLSDSDSAAKYREHAANSQKLLTQTECEPSGKTTGTSMLTDITKSHTGQINAEHLQGLSNYAVHATYWMVR